MSFTTLDLIAASDQRVERRAARAPAGSLQELHRRRHHADGAADGPRGRHHPRRPGESGAGRAHQPCLHHVVPDLSGPSATASRSRRANCSVRGSSSSRRPSRCRSYAIVGAQKGVNVGLPVAGVLALAVVAPTAGRWYVDVSCGVPPKQFIRGEWFVAVALLTGIVWVLCDTAGLDTWAERRDRLRHRLHPPRARPLPRVGGTTRQRTGGRRTCTTTAARSSAASSRASRSAR